jgi:dTDP-4-amino-4,6-dideoxygalactose transaminase
VHYIPLYRHPVFAKRAGDISGYFPETESYYARALTLPLYYDLELKDVDFVVDKLLQILRA